MKYILLFILACTNSQLVAQSMAVGIKDSIGIAYIEKEMRVKLLRTPGDKVLQFTFEQSMERNLGIKVTDSSNDLLPIEAKKENDTWIIDLSLLPYGTYIVLLYDYDANKLAHIKVSKKGKRK